MEIATMFLLFILFFAALLYWEIKNREKKKPLETEQKNNIPYVTEFPYKKKYLLTKTEYRFYNVLKPQCDIRNMLICLKVRLEDFINTTAEENRMKYRGYIKSRHVDFIICDGKLNIVAAIELDDRSHNGVRASQVDDFKNRLFQAVGIPLYRITVKNGSEYMAEICRILDGLHAGSGK